MDESLSKSSLSSDINVTLISLPNEKSPGKRKTPTIVMTEPKIESKKSALKIHDGVKKQKSKISFTPGTEDKEDDDEEDEEKRAKMLLRSRRQSRGGGPEIRLEVNTAVSGQQKKLAQVTKKVAEKILVNNLIRTMKMTELEVYSKNQKHLAYLNRIADETKREINVSLQEQLMNETLNILLITLDGYRKDLGVNHPVMENIEERVTYIEEVLETQEFNRVYEKQTFMQKIAEKTRNSRLPLGKEGSQLSFFRNSVFTEENTQDGISSFRRSYSKVNSLSPNINIIATICIICAFISLALFYRT